MNSFTKMAVCAMAFVGLSIASAETFNLAEKNYLKKQLGNHSTTGTEFSTKGKTFLLSSKIFDVDPAKKYSFKMTVSEKNSKRTRVYIGFLLYDVNGRDYAAHCWQGHAPSFTQVTKAAKKGDTVIYVKNGSGWVAAGTFYIALNAKADGSDIPNTNVITNTMKSKEKKGDEWVITLKQPLKADIAAGTNVRQNIAGGYYYSVIKDIKPTEKEVVLTGTVQGYKKEASAFDGKTWPAAVKKARLLILADWFNAGADISYKDATFVIE